MTIADRATARIADDRGKPVGTRLAVRPISFFRVLGFLTVLTFHAYQNSGYRGFAGWPGEELWERLLVGGAAGAVDAFFVITTFLVSRSVVRGALRQGPPVSGRALLVRQASALLPAYYIAVFLVWALSNPSLTGHWEDLLLHLTFTQVFSDTYIFWTLGPAWFIAVAVQFYVLIAVGAGPLQRYCSRLPDRAAQVRVLLGVIAGIGAVCWIYKLAATYLLNVPATSWSAWFGPVARIDLLGMGIGLAVISVLQPRVSAAARWLLWAAAGGTALLAVLSYPNEITSGGLPGFWQDSAFGLAAFLVLVPAVTPRTVAQASSIGGRAPWGWVTTAATLTYGVYIWQEPILRVLNGSDVLPADSSPWAFPVTTVVLLLLSLAAAKIGYHLIEEPGRSFAAWSQRRTAPALPPATELGKPDPRQPNPWKPSPRPRSAPPVDLRSVPPPSAVPQVSAPTAAPPAAVVPQAAVGSQAPAPTTAPPEEVPVPAVPEPAVRSRLGAPSRSLLGVLAAAAPVLLLGVLAVLGADQRAAGGGEAAIAAGAALGPDSPLVGLAWPDAFGAYQIAALDALLGSVGQQSVIDAARAVLLVVNMAVCLLLWPTARRLGLSAGAAAFTVALCALPGLLVAGLYGSVDVGGLAAMWVAVAAAVVGRTRPASAVAAGAAVIAGLTAPLAAVGLLTFAAHTVLIDAFGLRWPRRVTRPAAAATVAVAVAVAVASTGSGPWAVSGGGTVAPPLLVGILVVGVVVSALAWWRVAWLRPAVTAAGALLICAAVPGLHTMTALLLVVPVLAVLAGAVLDSLTARSPSARRILVAAVLVGGVVSGGPLLAAATAPDPDRTSLATWVQTQLDDTAVQVDPLTGAELVHDGIPATRLVAAADPGRGALPFVQTPPPGVPQPTATRLLVTLPDGPGGTPVDVRQPQPDEDRVDQRRQFGSQLAGNRALVLTAASADVLRRGEVDERLATVLAGLSAEYRVTIGEFVAVPGEPASAPRRTAIVTAIDGLSTAVPGASEPVQRWLAGQQPPYRPATVALEGDALVVRYTIASRPSPG